VSLVRTAVSSAFSLGALALVGVALAGAAPPSERAARGPWSPEPTETTAETAAGDTLRYQVRAGQPLLVALPSRAGGREAAYSVVSAPAMSWLVDRSFFWQTIPTERGLMPVLFRQTAAEADTLVLLVEITD
jgi:hypothetical protein